MNISKYVTNWRTSLGGLAMALTGAAALAGVNVGPTPMDPQAAVGLILGGIGMLFAKDGNK